MPKSDDEKRGKEAAGALLLLSRRAQKAAEDEADEAVDKAVSEATRQSKGDRLKKAALYAALLAISQRFSQGLAEALGAARGDARKGALRRAGAELAAIGVGLPTALRGGAKGRAAGDEAQATAGADAAAAVWRASAIVAVSRAVREGTNPAEAVEATRRQAVSRATLAARTETATAYNEEHILAVREAAEADPEFAAELERRKVVRVWCSALEDRTCDRCASQHGDTASIDGSYPSGDTPGDVHPHCLCTEYLSTEA